MAVQGLRYRTVHSQAPTLTPIQFFGNCQPSSFAALPQWTSPRVRGFGDPTFGPGLQWAPKKIGNRVFVRRFVLTGTYSDRRPVNIGNHFDVVAPIYPSRGRSSHYIRNDEV